MKWFFCFFFLFSFSTFAQVKSTYFLYDDKKIQIDPRSFTRYVLPQIKAINQEFFLILKKLHPLHESTIKTYQHLKEMERDYISFSQTCSKLNEKCLQSLQDIYKQSRELENLLLKPQSKNMDFSLPQNIEHVDSLLHLISDMTLIGNTNYQLMHTLEEYLLTANTTFFHFFDGKRTIEPKIHQMVVTADLMLIPLMKEGLKDPFHAVWVHFFSKLNEHLLHEKDQKFLISRLEELNLSWNTFHMKMTKENNDLPSNMIKLIKIMHNRWNSCLKIILR